MTSVVVNFGSRLRRSRRFCTRSINPGSFEGSGSPGLRGRAASSRTYVTSSLLSAAHCASNAFRRAISSGVGTSRIGRLKSYRSASLEISSTLLK